MRILIISDLYPPHFLGGYELQCKFHADELASRGHEICVLTSRWKVGRTAIKDNVYRLLHFNPIIENLRLRKSLSDPLRLLRRFHQMKWAFACRRNYGITREIVAKIKPDIAYIWNMGSVSISPLLAVQDYGIPLVFIICDYWLANVRNELHLETNYVKKYYRSAIVGIRDFTQLDLTHLLLPSQSMMEEYIGLGFPDQNIKIIPNGLPEHIMLDIDDLQNLSQNNRRKRKLLFVGRLVPEKGPDVAIKALAHLVKDSLLPDIQLDIIGTGSEEYEGELREIVIAHELIGRVHFLGKLEYQELLERYEKYDSLLFTSRWKEPFGMTIIEAMARGLPVIASNIGGPLTIIQNGENGLLVPPNEPLMLANAVKRLIQDSTLIRKIQHKALNTVRINYTNKRIVNQVEDYLQMVLQQSRT